MIYQRKTSFIGKCLGISVVPLSAGHTIGGAIWRIKKDTDEIVYAVSYNHKMERYNEKRVSGRIRPLRHLNGTVLDSFSRPSLLITDSFNATNVQSTRKQRDVELMGTIS
jgi:cleavage and polyadenylation specificity factor subunit 2